MWAVREVPKSVSFCLGLANRKRWQEIREQEGKEARVFLFLCLRQHR